MADFRFDINEEFEKKLMELQDIDHISPKILNATIGILTNGMKEECKKHKRTGMLMDSVKAKRAEKNQHGWYVITRPTGTTDVYMNEDGKIRKRDKPVRNMAILMYNEYGSAHQNPTPIVRKVQEDYEDEILDALQEEYNKIVEG